MEAQPALAGHCMRCLRRGHNVTTCTTPLHCGRCNVGGQHHTAFCTRFVPAGLPKQSSPPGAWQGGNVRGAQAAPRKATPAKKGTNKHTVNSKTVANAATALYSEVVVGERSGPQPRAPTFRDDKWEVRMATAQQKAAQDAADADAAHEHAHRSTKAVADLRAEMEYAQERAMHQAIVGAPLTVKVNGVAPMDADDASSAAGYAPVKADGLPLPDESAHFDDGGAAVAAEAVAEAGDGGREVEAAAAAG